jgi:DNA-binding PadR family transcriptional regulator
MHGYQMIQEIARRSDGAWKPSPGSVYPALQQLEDEGLIRATELEGRKVFELTDSGRSYVEDHADEVRAPWEQISDDVPEAWWSMQEQIMQIVIAYRQVVHMGDPRQVEQAHGIVEDTRRALYRILSEEPQSTDGSDA